MCSRKYAIAIVEADLKKNSNTHPKALYENDKQEATNPFQKLYNFYIYCIRKRNRFLAK